MVAFPPAPSTLAVATPAPAGLRVGDLISVSVGGAQHALLVTVDAPAQGPRTVVRGALLTFDPVAVASPADLVCAAAEGPFGRSFLIYAGEEVVVAQDWVVACLGTLAYPAYHRYVLAYASRRSPEYAVVFRHHLALADDDAPLVGPPLPDDPDAPAAARARQLAARTDALTRAALRTIFAAGPEVAP